MAVLHVEVIVSESPEVRVGLPKENFFIAAARTSGRTGLFLGVLQLVRSNKVSVSAHHWRQFA
jgi:hypothetical protein